MARIVLVTGGSRSGKSAYAQQRAERQPGKRLFVATCPVLDPEMQARVARHKRERAAGQWDTVEEQVQIASVIEQAPGHDTVLVDCLTLWINNLMYQHEREGADIDEDIVAAKSRELLAAAQGHPGLVIFVTNEVGLGIVPENALARRFRDLAGRCNQVIGRAADEVVLLCCGVDLKLKGS